MTSLNEIRVNGIGSNHKVIDPADGFRKDNRLWFGKCSECGEGVTSSLHNKGEWTHTIYSIKGYYSMDNYKRGIYNHGQSREVAYCPTAKGETHPCEVYVMVDGEKVTI